VLPLPSRARLPTRLFDPSQPFSRLHFTLATATGVGAAMATVVTVEVCIATLIDERETVPHVYRK